MLQRRGRDETVHGEQSTGAVPTSYPHQPQSRDQWSTWMDNLLGTSIDASSGRIWRQYRVDRCERHASQPQQSPCGRERLYWASRCGCSVRADGGRSNNVFWHRGNKSRHHFGRRTAALKGGPSERPWGMGARDRSPQPVQRCSRSPSAHRGRTLHRLRARRGRRPNRRPPRHRGRACHRLHLRHTSTPPKPPPGATDRRLRHLDGHRAGSQPKLAAAGPFWRLCRRTSVPPPACAKLDPRTLVQRGAQHRPKRAPGVAPTICGAHVDHCWIVFYVPSRGCFCTSLGQPRS